MESETQKKSFWFTKWGLLLFLLFWPFLLLYWGIIKQNWNPFVKIGAIVSIFIIFVVGAASSQPNNASSLSSQTTISPVQKAQVTHSGITIAPTIKPTITPKPTIVPTAKPLPTNTPIPTRYIAPTAVYVQPTTPPVPAQSSTGLSNDNYYTNVNGNEVHSPADSTNGSVPAGATAQCNDGTYSFSQNHSGTCSHHGGVAQWL